MYRLTDVDAEIDLGGFSRFLGTSGVGHRITEEGGRQVVWLEDQRAAEPTMRLLQAYLQDPLMREHMGKSPSGTLRQRPMIWQARPGQAPFVLGLIIVAALTAWLTGFGARGPLQWLVFVDPRDILVNTLAGRWDVFLQTLAGGQWWRLFTPDFLHFSLSHLLFNGVMLWFLGSQIEVREGWPAMLGLFLVASLVSNLTQYLLTGPLFGGLSGVVYAALGYVWLAQRVGRPFVLPPALMTVALVWLVLGLTPLPQALGLGSMANGAHLGGLLAGLGWGAGRWVLR